jgi:hypothetical protein
LNYRVIHKKYLAEALSFLGFKYYKFNDLDADTQKEIIKYSFIESPAFNNALDDLLLLKEKYRVY